MVHQPFRTMARHQRPDEPVSAEQHEAMPDRIEGAFDRVRELLAEDLGGEPEDYEPDDLSRQTE